MIIISNVNAILFHWTWIMNVKTVGKRRRKKCLTSQSLERNCERLAEENKNEANSFMLELSNKGPDAEFFLWRNERFPVGSPSKNCFIAIWIGPFLTFLYSMLALDFISKFNRFTCFLASFNGNLRKFLD